jgi:uncharacterized protein YcaQ
MDKVKINVQISFEQLVDAVRQLSPKQKLKLNELLLDENSLIPIQHQKLVMARVKEARKNPERMLDWDEVSKKLA